MEVILIDVGQSLARTFAKPMIAERVRHTLLEAIQLADEPPPVRPLILDRIA